MRVEVRCDHRRPSVLVREKVGIVLNRRYQFTSPAKRLWVLAEELRHVLLEHRLVESNVPSRRPGLYEPGRAFYEREKLGSLL